MKNWILIAVGTIFLVVIIWLCIKLAGGSSAIVAALASKLKEEDPNLSDEEANAQAAAETNAEYLAQLRAQEEEARIAEQAALAKALEEALARAEAEALAAQDAAAKAKAAAEAAALEEQAKAERAKLEAMWTTDLNAAVEIMNEMKLVAQTAVNAVVSAQDKLDDCEALVERYRLGVTNTNTILQNTTNETVRATLIAKLNEYKTLYQNALAKVESAKIVLNSTRISANAAIRDAQDAVGDVLGLTRDLQNLGILLALANRTDTLAQATRTALNSLEAKISS